MKLLLLTKQFPYGTGEAFIENEISIAASYYEKIIIIACEVPQSMTSIRNVPANVVVHRVNARSKKLQMIIDVLAGVSGYQFDKSVSKTVLYQELDDISGIKRRVFLKYFEAKCNRIYSVIVKNKYLNDLTENGYILYSYWLFATARVGTLIADTIRPRYMFSRAHRYDLYENKNALNYLPYRNYLLDAYETVIPCSEDGVRYLAENHSEYSAKIKASYLGTIDHNMEKWSVNSIFTIVSCSRVVSVKRVDRILDALVMLADRGKKIKWIHIGDGEELGDLQAKAQNAPKGLECIFKGNMLNADVMEYYKNSSIDLFVNVSSSEGLPVSIMEAISFGIPVVATDVGGTSEIVNNSTGRLIKSDFTISELADEIEKIVDIYDTDSYLALRLGSRNYWENHFVAEDNYKQLYDELGKYNEEI